MPFWDQWDAEAANLYKPWLEGNVNWLTFFGSHNEHRILTTRILHIALFELNGREWAPKAQMLCNAVIHIAAIGILVGFLRSAVGSSLARVLAWFACLVYMIPFGWENTLAGFQTQFYLLLLLSFMLIWLSSICYPNLIVILWAILLSFLLVFTMASGSLSVFAAGIILCFRRLVLKEWISRAFIFILFLISIFGIFFTPSIEGHSVLKATNFYQLIVAIGAVCAWPLRPSSVTLLAGILPVLMQMPLLLALVFSYRHRALNSQPLVLFFGLAVWFGLQVFALAYGRATACYASRYLDVISVGLVVNFSAILFLLTKSESLFKKLFLTVSIFWLFAFSIGVWKGVPLLHEQILSKAKFSGLQEHNVRRYLLTGNYQWLLDARHMEIPYPDPARLQQLLNDPTIKSFIPLQFRPPHDAP
jgi:hypothetical protein